MLHQGFSCLFSPKVDIGQSTELLFFLALFQIMCSLYVPFHKSTISVNDVEGKYVKRIFGLHNFGIFLRGHLHGRRFDPSSSSSFIQPQPSHPFAVHGNSKILCKISMSFTLCVLCSTSYCVTSRLPDTNPFCCAIQCSAHIHPHPTDSNKVKLKQCIAITKFR